MFFLLLFNLVCKHGERERERIVLVRNDLKQWSEKQKCMVEEEYEVWGGETKQKIKNLKMQI